MDYQSVAEFLDAVNKNNDEALRHIANWALNEANEFIHETVERGVTPEKADLRIAAKFFAQTWFDVVGEAVFHEIEMMRDEDTVEVNPLPRSY